MTARLATGASITVKKRAVGIHYTLKGEQYDAYFIVLDLNDNIDVILGLPRLRRIEKRVSRQHLYRCPICLSDGHLMNVFERPQACRCTESECDGLTCGTVASTTVQDRSVVDHYSVEKTPGNCASSQADPRYHHSKTSGSGQGCMPGR